MHLSSCFIKINNQASSGNGFTKFAPWACCIQDQTNRGSTVECSDVGAVESSPGSGCGSCHGVSPLNWHFGPLPVRPNEDGASRGLKWAWVGPKLKRLCLLRCINTVGPGVVSLASAGSVQKLSYNYISDVQRRYIWGTLYVQICLCLGNYQKRWD